VSLTKKSSYGLIAALELAADVSEGPISAGMVAAKYSLPAPFVEKILHQLKLAGLVNARKGRGGGYYLSVDPASLSVLRVLEALDESLDLVGCLGPNSNCQLTQICPTKSAWAKIDQRFKALLDSLTLSDLLEQ